MSVKMIEGDDNIRRKKYMQAVEKLSEEFDCMLLPRIMITGMPDGSTQITTGIIPFVIPREAGNVPKDDIRNGDGQVRNNKPGLTLK